MNVLPHRQHSERLKFVVFQRHPTDSDSVFRLQHFPDVVDETENMVHRRQ